MIVEFTCRYSNSPAKIGTQVQRLLKLRTPSVPTQESDQIRKLSVDKTVVARSVVAKYRTIDVEYIFPASELALDDEFRESVVEDPVFTMDGTAYSRIGEVLTVSMDTVKVPTTEEGDYLIRSFTATVIG